MSQTDLGPDDCTGNGNESRGYSVECSIQICDHFVGNMSHAWNQIVGKAFSMDFGSDFDIANIEDVGVGAQTWVAINVGGSQR